MNPSASRATNSPTPAPKPRSGTRVLRFWFALHCGLLAIAIVLFVLAWRDRHDERIASVEADTISMEEVRELERTVARLKAAMEANSAELRQSRSELAVADPADVPSGNPIDAVAAVVDSASRSPSPFDGAVNIEQLRKLAEASVPYPSGSLKDPAKLAEVHEIFGDASRTDAERATALTILRRETVNGLEVAAAFPDDVVEDAAWLVTNSKDAGARRTLASALVGVRNDRLRELWLDSLRSDGDARFRERAAENLALYADDARVREALRESERYDSSSEVQNSARKAQSQK